ncbi:hypothetical protein CPT_Saba_037 [Proteus phage Saba]|uniref:DUF7768 domain-containing protein n=1 Tax=Proteus phage Saba TaxID=2596672 RepID=A0A5B9NBN8_9CAUD|nr:nucleoside 2-deoxyribosyltransferase [Proteus phage Saba]QEG09410.1 hypothetical protein CPT_Saba_037 [Proteus phage Saba]
MKLVYIAGPYRADTSDGIVKNIKAAEDVAISLSGQGYDLKLFPVTPHLNTARFEFHVPAGDHYWLGGTMALMEKCDIVLLTHPEAGNHSKGTSEEMKRAFELGKPVYSSLALLIQDARNDVIGLQCLNYIPTHLRKNVLYNK